MFNKFNNIVSQNVPTKFRGWGEMLLSIKWKMEMNSYAVCAKYIIFFPT